MKVYITRPIPKIGVTMLKNAGHRVVIQPEHITLSPRKLKAEVKDFDAIISFLNNRIDDEVMGSAGSQLKVVSNYAVGFDNIDLSAARERGIKVGNTPCHEVSQSVAEHTFALMLSLSRRIIEADTFTRAKKYKGWDPDLLVGNDIYEKTLGVVGLGMIGRELVRRAARGFSMKVLYHDIARDKGFEREFGAKFLPLDQLLSASDIVSLHVPLLPATHHLINTKTLKMMKRTAMLINTARGPVVDEVAVTKALYAKKLGGFALDVFECEPYIDCNPRDTLELRLLPNVIMTPHIASATVRARNAMAIAAVQNVLDGLAGKPLTYAVKGRM